MKNILFFCFFIFEFSFSQVPNIEWMKDYGGSNNEYFRSVIKTLDGGYLIGGYSGSDISGLKTESRKGFNFDYWVLKLDATGVIEWQKDLGGGGTNPFTELSGEVFTSVSQSGDGSYYICGYSDSPILGDKTQACYGSDDYWIVKLSSSGVVLWDKTIGGSSADRCYAISSTPDGGCVIGGQSYSGISGNKTESSRGSWDYWVVKLSASGTIDWQKTLGGTGTDSAYSIVTNNDGSCLVGGVSNSNISGDKTQVLKGYADVWLIKLTNSGAVDWQKDYGGTAGNGLYSIKNTPTGYVLGCESSSDISGDKSENSRGLNDYWIINIDFGGNIIWDKTLGGAGNENILQVDVCPNGGFVIVGASDSSISGEKTENTYGGTDGWIVRTDNLGNVLWDKDVGGTSPNDGLNQIIALNDNSFITGGDFFSTPSGNISSSGSGGLDYVLLKFSPEDLRNESFISSSFQIYPNPTSSIVNIKTTNENIQSIQLLDIQGRVVVSQIINTSICQIDLSNYQKGTYFLKLTTTNERKVVKVIKN